MSTNEQDRTDGAAVSTINREKYSAVLVGGHQLVGLETLSGAVAMEMGPRAGGDGYAPPLTFWRSPEALRALSRIAAHHADHLEAEQRGEAALKALTPDQADSLAVAADMVREERAA